MPLRRRFQQPTEASAEIDDLERLGDPDVPELEGSGTHDTPDLAAVLQGETDQPDVAIPVRLAELSVPLPVDFTPTRIGGLFSKKLAASPAGSVQILNEDPRRSRITITAVNAVRLGRTQAEADDANGFLFAAVNASIVFHWQDSLWARSDGAAATLSVCVELWSR